MPISRFLAPALVAALVLTSGAARAIDCPPGSLHKAVDGFSWCEPTVCNADDQCDRYEVCRPVALCLMVGTINGDASALAPDGGMKLVATQQCAPDKKCPRSAVCSELGRCVARSAAARMGILEAGDGGAPALAASDPPAGSALPGAGGGAGQDRRCGCRVIGAPAQGGGAALGAIGVAILSLRARARRRARRP